MDKLSKRLITKACLTKRGREIVHRKHLALHKLFRLFQVLDEWWLNDLNDTAIFSDVSGNKEFLTNSELLHTPLRVIEIHKLEYSARGILQHYRGARAMTSRNKLGCQNLPPHTDRLAKIFAEIA